MNGEHIFNISNRQLPNHSKNSFRAPEALFQPSMIGLEATGIHEQVYVQCSRWVLLG